MQRWSGVLKTRTLAPRGANVVRLKSNAPFNWDSAERRVLIQDGQRRLRVKVACKMRLPKRCNMKAGSQLLRLATRCSLLVCMARLVALVK